MGSNSRHAYTRGSPKKIPSGLRHSLSLSLFLRSPSVPPPAASLPPWPADRRPPLPPMCRRPLLLPSLPELRPLRCSSLLEPGLPPPSPLTSSSSPRWWKLDSLQGAPPTPSSSRPVARSRCVEARGRRGISSRRSLRLPCFFATNRWR
jgi:hypothetical protein